MDYCKICHSCVQKLILSLNPITFCIFMYLNEGADEKGSTYVF